MDVDDLCFFLNRTVCRMCAGSVFLLCGYQKVCVASVISRCFPVNYLAPIIVLTMSTTTPTTSSITNRIATGYWYTKVLLVLLSVSAKGCTDSVSGWWGYSHS